MSKVSFSHKIDDSFAECFEKLHARLGPPKFRILEVAIEVFDSLPSDTQHLLKSYNQEQRDLIYRVLGTVRLDSIQSEATDSSITECIDTVREVGTRYKIPDKAQQQLIDSLRKALGPETDSVSTDADKDIAGVHKKAQVRAAKKRQIDHRRKPAKPA